MAKREPVDNSMHFKNTDSLLRDKVYNWIVRKYGKNGHPWLKVDTILWTGFLYTIVGMIGYLIVIGALWWFLGKTIEYSGPEKAVLLMLILMFVQLLRMNAMLRKIDKGLSG